MERWLETLHESKAAADERFPYVYDAINELEYSFTTFDGLKVLIFPNDM